MDSSIAVERSEGRSRHGRLLAKVATPGGALVCVGAYLVLLLLLISTKPLWLDELIQLQATSGTSFRQLLQHVIQNAGGAPLGYVVQHWFLSVLGTNSASARLPSVLAGAGSLGIFLLMHRRLALRGCILATGLWIICPMTFRYSLEGRPYMQAMLLAMLAVLAQVRLRETCKASWAILLAACLIATVYSQPYAVFGILGFAACDTWQHRDLKYLTLTCGAYALAGVAFLPWLLTAQAGWVGSISHTHGGFQWNLPLAAVLFRECVGDGYFAAVPTALLGVYGAHVCIRRTRHDPRTPLVAAIVSSIVFALLADARFNYFFAIRQVFYMVPFLLLLVAEGAATLWERRHRSLTIVLVMAFAVASVTKNYHHLADHNEDWDRLSGALIKGVDGGCILLPGGESEVIAAIYGSFRPEISGRLCTSWLAARVIMPVHSYTDPAGALLTADELSARGMVRVSAERIGFARVETFERH